MNFKLKTYKKFKVKDYEYYVIGADLGGTHSRIGFAGVKRKKTELLFSLTYRSHSFKTISSVLKHAKKSAKEGFGINIKRTCIAAAGPIIKNRNFCEMTNANWNIDRRKLIAQTRLKILPLLNDLEVIGYSLNKLQKKDILKIVSGRRNPAGTKTVVASSTGLGKCRVSVVNNKIITTPSEFGNNDFGALTKEDLMLAEFIKKKRNIKNPVQYEDVVTGPGIVHIYEFLSKSKKSKFHKRIIAEKDKSAAISHFSKRDPVCRQTMKLYAYYLGRFVKNVALNDIPDGGIYLMGSTVSKNIHNLGKTFEKEFLNSETHQKILKSIPIYVVLTDDAGLIGACEVAAKGEV